MKGGLATVGTVIITAFGLLIGTLVASIYFPVFQFQKETTVSENAELNAERIAGIINLFQEVDRAEYKYPLPPSECSVKIKKSYVEVTLNDMTAKKKIIKNPDVTVKENEIECDREEIKKVKIVKDYNITRMIG